VCSADVTLGRLHYIRDNTGHNRENGPRYLQGTLSRGAYCSRRLVLASWNRKFSKTEGFFSTCGRDLLVRLKESGLFGGMDRKTKKTDEAAYGNDARKEHLPRISAGLSLLFQIGLELVSFNLKERFVVPSQQCPLYFGRQELCTSGQTPTEQHLDPGVLP
jgi:hypothetical protein